MQPVPMGTFTDIFCESNWPNECEIIEDMVQIDHGIGFGCFACGPSSNEPIASDDELSSRGSSSLSTPARGVGTTAVSSSSSYDAVASSVGCAESASSVTTCDELRMAIETGGEGCIAFYLGKNLECDTAITVSSDQDVTVVGLFDGTYSWISAVSPFNTPSPSEAQLGASVFIVEVGGQLTLKSMGFVNEALESVRVVHSYGNLYVEDCDWRGAGTSDDEYGGAVSAPSHAIPMLHRCSFRALGT